MDLREFIPESYFESDSEKFQLNQYFNSSEHLSHEIRWGYLAYKLGKKLFFESTVILSARQISASDLLMNLGLLACAEVAGSVSLQLSINAKNKGISDGNAGVVAEQLDYKDIPILLKNVRYAFEQYLLYLEPHERKPLQSLFISEKHLINNCKDSGDIKEIVTELIKEFKDLIENNGLWKLLWNDTRNPTEKNIQQFFLAIASSFCKANNIDLSPETDSGNGPVDFKFSHGFKSKIVVEIKLSTNTRLVHGYEQQLEIYKNSENTDEGIFIIVDIGNIGNKYNKVLTVREKILAQNGKASEIWYVDAKRKDSASKRAYQ